MYELTPYLMKLPQVIAQKYARHGTYLREELESEGALTLVKCAHLYDPDNGAKFETYAFNSIERAMWRLLGMGCKYNHRRRWQSVCQLEQEYSPADREQPEPGHLAEISEEVRRVLKYLVADQQAVFVLYHAHGMKLSSIGRCFGFSTQWASLTLRQARERIVKVLEMRGELCESRRCRSES